MPVGALVSAWPALALVGAFELLMMLVGSADEGSVDHADGVSDMRDVPALDQVSASALPSAPTLEQTVRAWHDAGHSQRAMARELNIDRRRVKRIIEEAA